MVLRQLDQTIDRDAQLLLGDRRMIHGVRKVTAGTALWPLFDHNPGRSMPSPSRPDLSDAEERRRGDSDDAP